MSRSLSVTRLLTLLVFFSFGSMLAHAQFRASLRGTVTDQQGAAVPDATVTLTNTATNQKMVATSDANGIYQFNALGPAPYSLSAEHAGFKTRVLDNVQIIPEQLNALDLQLEVGEVAQTVTVSGTTQTLDTETATVSGTVSTNQIQHMPSFNRDIFQLAQLAPGMFGDAAQHKGGGASTTPGNQGPGGTPGGSGGIFATENGPQVQSAGGQYETNSINIDGISTVSAVWGGTSVITPSEDSVETMKVVSNSYDAQNGRFTGAQIQVITKGGTNQFHGSAFFKASRPGLNAYQAWNGLGSNKSGTPAERGVNRDEGRFNQYGGSLGGPIWKNKVFAFFNWETSPFASSTTAQGWYETSQFASAATPGSIAAQYLSFPGNAVSSNGIIQRSCGEIGLTEGANCNTVTGGLDIGSPLTTGLGMQDLTYGGNPGTPGVGAGLDGIPDIAFFNTVNPTRTSQMQYTGRVDANLTQKDRLTFTIYYVPVGTTNFNGPVRSANLWHHSQVNNAYTAIWNRTFSATLLNEARVNAAGWRWNEVASNPQEPFGLPATSIDTIGGTAANTTAATIQYFGPPGPSILNQWTYSYSDVLTKIHGRHSIRVGGEFTRLFYLNEVVYAARPGFGFHNIWDFANDAPYGEGGNFGGQFDYRTGIPFANRQDDRENLWGAFAQDDFKITPTLTVNLGLRWSYFGALYTKQNNQDVMLFGSGPNPLDGLNVRVGGNLYTPQKTNLGPAVGFAWSPMRWQNKVVVRGGFGINYNQNEIAITANAHGNPPNAVTPFFHCDFPFTTNPSCAGTGILYQTAGDINSIFGYAPNPAAITTLGPGNLPASGNAVLTGFQANPKTISSYHYSIDLQDQIAANWIVTLGYIGNQTRHLLVHNNWNTVGAANGFAMNPLVNTINFWENTGNANYNAMVSTLTHNFSHTFQATAQYTWARSMDELSGPYYQDPYPFDPSNAYGRSNYDVRNAFKLYGLWQPVFFHGNHNWIEKIAGGWSVSGIWNWHTGFPWDPFYNASTNLYYQNSGYGQLRPADMVSGFGTSTANKRFEQTINPNYGGDGTRYFLPPTFVAGPSFPATAPAPTPGIGRNSLNGPGYNDLDISLAKAFGLPRNKVLGEGARFEIRADIYNLFNTTNIDVSTIDAALGAVDPTGAVTQVNHDFGVAGAALGSRTIQLQARFSF